ncbi:NAD(P)-dependent oxidoreductase [Promicromonospora sp. NPDC050262]|uniref:NAD(P)-dependent oxidoreductase n=1 Tax=Promicromonospora sp. NPDC050262 TaxID=3155036 RepID=UPI0033D634F9
MGALARAGGHRRGRDPRDHDGSGPGGERCLGPLPLRGRRAPGAGVAGRRAPDPHHRHHARADRRVRADLVLAERWQVARYLAQSTTATWDASKPPASPDRRTAVVVGTGAMGAAIAGTLATLGYRVVGLSRTGRPARAFDAVLPLAQAFDATSPEPTTSRAPSPTEQVFDTAQADVLVLALPHTPQTDGLITPRLLRAFERVHLVNIGRGSAVRTATLLDALDSGRVRHATLDVVEREPLEASSPLWRRPDVTITPHVSGLTLPSDVVAGLDAALTAIRAGARPESAVARDRGY